MNKILGTAEIYSKCAAWKGARMCGKLRKKINRG
jgi:hypothetical protein